MTISRGLVVFFAFAAIQAAFAQQPSRGQDPNTRPATAAGFVAPGVPGVEIAGETFREYVTMATKALTNTTLCAVVIVAGPRESLDIRVGVSNVAVDRLDVLILDSFRARRGQSLLHQAVFDTAAPAFGSMNVLYPTDDNGKGPIVLSFTSFDQFDSAAFSTDPDTYDDLDFGANVGSLDQSVLEVVYTNGLRCRGTLDFKPARNASVANLVQVFP